jgi:hypothetical protein
MDVDERFADSRIVFRKLLGKFNTAFGEDGRFQRDRAADTPGSFG